MRVFMSWSGELSRELAEAFRNWLPSALQYVKPYFTPADIEKGSKWATEIFKELSASSICVLVLTRDNLASNWIMFEAGAISTTIDRAKVCPVIFDLEETDLQGPLAQFQATRFFKEDVRKLFFTINGAAAEQKLSDSVASAVFEKWWPDLETQITKVMNDHKTSKSTKDVRSDRDIIEELLLLTRKLSEASAKTSAVEAKPQPIFGSANYETSIHKLLVGLAKTFFDLGGFENDELTAIKTSVDRAINQVQRRVSSGTIRKGLSADLTALSSEIDAYIQIETDAKDEAESEQNT
ncbi:toll/interleukin-1 receptor domain-containing protein [Bradyrhizobium sp. A11]|uniref:toll/interleukin-1 receptor domain-containing protein n=1 Tax=Bradyrhizobium sp. A11 TaxID=3133974 RepID=UPI003253D592